MNAKGGGANAQSAELNGYSVVVSNVYWAVTSSVTVLSPMPPEAVKSTLTVVVP